MSALLSRILKRLDRRLTLVDVGARWGPPSGWTSLCDHADVICFEPDAEEARRLQAAAAPNISYLPVALGAEEDRELTLTVTRDPACSSVYAPVRSLYTYYPALKVITPEREVRLPSRTLDGVLGGRQVDAIKLDTQGSELDILQGGRLLLSTCSLIDIEVELNPIYEGQNLFCDVDRFLRDHGFVLWRFSELVHYATQPAETDMKMRIAVAPGFDQDISVGSGQLFWGQAQYVRSEFPRTGPSTLTIDRAIPAAAVAGLAGLWDLSVEILRKADVELAEQLSSCCRSTN